MQIFKKIIFSIFIFLLTLATVSTFFCLLFFDSGSEDYLDGRYRKELSGQLNYYILGSSEGMCSVIPEIIDKELNVNSYNLSGSMLSLTGKQAIIKDELKRNKVDTVVLFTGSDIDYDNNIHYSEGEMYLIPRIDTFCDKISYFFKNVCIRDYVSVYSFYMKKGCDIFINKIIGNEVNIDHSQKGYYEKKSENITMSDDTIVSSFQKSEYSLGNEKNIELIEKLIKEICSYNVKVLLITPIYSEYQIWQYKNSDNVSTVYQSIACNCNCIYLDFNLIKDRKYIFSDSNSFADEVHMSSDGAEVFTNLFCDVMKKVEAGEDVSDMFYDSYEEAITHFEYYERYTELTKGQ